jgi:hypothetical protein
VLGVTLFGGGLWWAYPRAMAAVKLHDAATALADYALCMVGPTGPSLVRDNPSEFRRLVRRRLVSATADERPFAKCAKAARELSDSATVERAHLAPAVSFVEFGGNAQERYAAGSRAELTARALDVSAARLGALARRAGLFARDGYTQLVKPSLSAFEAIHPVAPARPALGRGLPGYRTYYRAIRASDQGWLAAFGQGAHLVTLRSPDQGATWTSAPPHTAGMAELTERCPAGENRWYTLGLGPDARFLTVTSLGSDGVPFTAALGKSSLELVGAACDDTALVAALANEQARDVVLRLCHYRQICTDLVVPPLPGVGATPRLPLDIARLRGVTVVAVNMYGIVRVTSSRDDGQTWTPYAVAFDREAYPEVRADVAVPDRLVAAGGRLLLYGAARSPTATYPLLVSDDFGASWRSPPQTLRVARVAPGRRP